MKKLKIITILGLTLILAGCNKEIETQAFIDNINKTELNSEQNTIINSTLEKEENSKEKSSKNNENTNEALVKNENDIEEKIDVPEDVENNEKAEADVNITKEVTLSFAGDCTLGRYLGQSYENSFDHVYDNKGGAFFLEDVKKIFENDDLTIVNLEGPFTNVTPTNDKTYPINCKPEHVDVLTSGSVELVNLANNHIWDSEQQGLNDTLQTLSDNNIGYFGEGYKHIEETNGIKVGFLGYRGFYIDNNILNGISNDITSLKNDDANIVVVFFHYGEERQYINNKDQERISKHAIDSGADIVIGGHPHVVQGIEIYNGKTICYSMGNFSFGANKNPSDKDTFIYQQTFKLNDDGTVSYNNHIIIPCRISSMTDWNDYRPTLLDGTDSERVLNRLKEYSSNYETSIFDIM